MALTKAIKETHIILFDPCSPLFERTGEKIFILSAANSSDSAASRGRSKLPFASPSQSRGYILAGNKKRKSLNFAFFVFVWSHFLSRLGIKSRAFFPFRVCIRATRAHPTGTSNSRSRSNANSGVRRGRTSSFALIIAARTHQDKLSCRVSDTSCSLMLVRRVCLLKGGNPPVIKGVAELRFDWGKQISHPSPKRKQ